MSRHSEWCVIGLWVLAATAAYPFTLSWDPSAGATGYRLYYGLASQDYDTVLDTGPATGAVVDGLTVDLTYYFAATAYHNTAESDYSNEVSAVIAAPDPTPPTVRLTSPADGATVPRKAEMMIQAEASDNVGVARVDIYVNGVLQCADGTPPYGCRWQP